MILKMRALKLFLGLLAAPGQSPTLATSDATSDCKCFPGEPCWPSIEQWDELNTTVGGRLIATIPLAIRCHDPFFDNATCSKLRDEWRDPSIHMSDPASVMAPFFANRSCDPFTAPDDPCRHGNYVRYAVNVSTADDIAAAVAFAREHSVRFVIRNTGHDYLGRSTGAGSLSVWTHHLKDVEFLDWSDGSYTGRAVRVGAGVQGFEVLTAARDEGLVVLTGECPSVGIAGGYTQGGGHSALSTSFGLSADNVLEWEVLTADGRVLTASPSENPDLYWALSGGGAGNYAVVLSMTVKAHPDAVVGGASLTISSADDTILYGAIEAFHAVLPAIIDAGSMVLYWVQPSTFQMLPLTAYNKTSAEVRAILTPYLDALGAMNITYDVAYSEYSSYHDHFDHYFGPIPNGQYEVSLFQYGSRLVPRSTFQDRAADFGETIRNMLEHGVNVTLVATDVSSFASEEKNAVVPAWRQEQVLHAVFTTPWSFDPEDWDDMLAYQELMTDTIMPAIEAITPGSGAYMNEADFRQPDFQTAFFGSNYERLLGIKRKYDPDFFFYATKGVGSEAWSVAEDGHMCRA